MSSLLKEAIGYAAASSCALAADVTLLWCMVYFFSWNYLISATISFLVGGVVAYTISVKIAFKQHRLQDRRLELVAFVAIGSVGLAVNAAVIYLAVNSLATHYLVAKFIAAGFTLLCNFAMRRQMLFAPTAPA